MSKKSRKRNKKILGLLGVLGAGLAMANRKPKQSSVSADSGRGSGLRPTVDDMEFKEQVVSAPIKKPIVNLGKMEGFGPEKGTIGQRKRANYATRIRDSQNADMMRAMRSNDAYRGMVPEVDFFSGASAKKGGRIVKTKSGGKALRGYGRAYKGKK